MAGNIIWAVYDAARSGPAREFQDRESALAYRNRKAAETGGHWAIRFRGTGAIITGKES